MEVVDVYNVGAAEEQVEKKASFEESSSTDEVEKTKIGIMRALLERSDDPSFKEVDDITLRRFLRARELNIDKASSMFLKCMSWRRSFIPDGSISPSVIPNELAQNKLFMQGLDRQGRPIVVLIGNRHKKTTLEDFKRFSVYALDKICSRMPQGKEKFIGIADLQGWGYANSDVRGYLASLSILQDYYPERLGKLFIVHAPYIFMTVWKMFYPFIDNKTKMKIVFVEGKKLKATLEAEIDESQLPEPYGGNMSLVPIQDC